MKYCEKIRRKNSARNSIREYEEKLDYRYRMTFAEEFGEFSKRQIPRKLRFEDTKKKSRREYLRETRRQLFWKYWEIFRRGNTKQNQWLVPQISIKTFGESCYEISKTKILRATRQANSENISRNQLLGKFKENFNNEVLKEFREKSRRIILYTRDSLTEY